MMLNNPNANYLDVWMRLDQSRRQGHLEDFQKLLETFLATGVDRIPILKQALLGRGRHTAVFVLDRLTIDELSMLFDELVWVASNSFGYVQAVRDAITRLPRQWVLQRIEQVAEPILNKGTHEEYQRLLELYILIDEDLTLRLARRAIGHEDIDIQEAGEAAMIWLKNGPTEE